MRDKVEIARQIDNLKVGDYIAFAWHHGFKKKEGGEIVVDNITSINEDSVLVHFLYGYKSESEWVKKSDILAIGNLESGEVRIRGWGGYFDIVKKDSQLLMDNLR